MWDSSHIHTHHTINQIGSSQENLQRTKDGRKLLNEAQWTTNVREENMRK